MTPEQRHEVWTAFSTLSDAQFLLQEFGDAERANQEINHAKIHLSEILVSWTQEERAEAMFPTSGSMMKCSVEEKYREFLDRQKKGLSNTTLVVDR